MTTSETINELAAALAKAQAEMGGAKKDSTNPHFKSAYADLASVREATKPLATHGIAVVQSCRMATTEAGMVAEVETRLIHTSGQWMADTLAVPVSKPHAQGIGSAITYGRRYTLAAFAGIAPADDDGEAAVGRQPGRPVALPAAKKPTGFDDWLADMEMLADEGIDPLKGAWERSELALRSYLIATNKAAWDAMKARAERVS